MPFGRGGPRRPSLVRGPTRGAFWRPGFFSQPARDRSTALRRVASAVVALALSAALPEALPAAGGGAIVPPQIHPVIPFNHATTGWALSGLHATTQCAQCHVNNNYSLTSAACWTCHQTDYNGATNPPHKAVGFPQDCTPCHGASAANWTSAAFNHAATGWVLTGLHATLSCAQCHVNNNFSLSSAACWNCHQVDYNGATNPPHKAAAFPQDCSKCHATTDWTGATFNHAIAGWPLSGLHATAQCAACHVSNNYSLTSAACWNCHQADYNRTTNPAHRAARLSQDCSLCHHTFARW